MCLAFQICITPLIVKQDLKDSQNVTYNVESKDHNIQLHVKMHDTLCIYYFNHNHRLWRFF